MTANSTRWIVTSLLLALAGVGAIVAGRANRKQSPTARHLDTTLSVVGTVLLIWGIYDLYWMASHLREISVVRRTPMGVPSAWAYRLMAWMVTFHAIVETLLGFLLVFGSVVHGRGGASPPAAERAARFHRAVALPQIALGGLATLLAILWVVVIVALPGV